MKRNRQDQKAAAKLAATLQDLKAGGKLIAKGIHSANLPGWRLTKADIQTAKTVIGKARQAARREYEQQCDRRNGTSRWSIDEAWWDYQENRYQVNLILAGITPVGLVTPIVLDAETGDKIGIILNNDQDTPETVRKMLHREMPEEVTRFCRQYPGNAAELLKEILDAIATEANHIYNEERQANMEPQEATWEFSDGEPKCEIYNSAGDKIATVFPYGEVTYEDQPLTEEQAEEACRLAREEWENYISL